MHWKTAGRPRKNPRKQQITDSDWTREELSIISATEQSSIVMLAIMVVKQWIKDGKPKTDVEGIRPWLHIIKDSLKEKGVSQQVTSIGRLND